MSLYGDIFELHHTIFVLEGTAPGSAGIKSLKTYLSNLKTKLTQVIELLPIFHFYFFVQLACLQD